MNVKQIVKIALDIANPSHLCYIIYSSRNTQEVNFVKLSELQKICQHFPSADPPKDLTSFHSFLQEVGIDPGSIYQEMEMDSAYVDTHQDISYSNSKLPLHSHPFYEILCCRSSCNTEYLLETERYKLQKGDIILVPPGISHRPLLAEPMTEPYIRDILWLNEDFLQLLTNTMPDLPMGSFREPFLFRTAGTGWEFICDMIHRGVKEAEAGQPGWRSLVTANTVSILVQLLRARQAQPVHPMVAEKPDLLDQVLTYVERHLSEKLSLSEIARQFYVSESTITQTFRKKMGISFYRCVTQRRLIAAKKLIERGISLDATAEQVGFTDYSSFFRAFKQEYGIAPRQYRKLHNKEPKPSSLP